MGFIKKSYILCRYCHQQAPLKTIPVYDDNFKKTGEKDICGFCKKEYEKDDIPFVQEKKPDKVDRTLDPTCDNCEHFVKNIFTQKCTLTGQTVNVYDSCDHFTPRPQKKKDLPFL